MDGWFEFVLARYNYWIVIVLMMTGLYIVFARGNLVKKVVGLTVFQTSVFIFYITIGKVAGGTAPIYIGGELDHGDGHGKGEGGHHGEGAGRGEGESLHAVPEGEAANVLSGDHGEETLASKIDNLPANDLKAALESLDPAPGPAETPSLHEPPEGDLGKISNDALIDTPKPEPAPGFDLAREVHRGAANALDAAAAHGEIIYTNPLPHVLILTAIVVGVSTTAVALALAVRIREAYGTIEEDELEALNEMAEFGHTLGPAGARG